MHGENELRFHRIGTSLLPLATLRRGWGMALLVQAGQRRLPSQGSVGPHSRGQSMWVPIAPLQHSSRMDSSLPPLSSFLSSRITRCCRVYLSTMDTSNILLACKTLCQQCKLFVRHLKPKFTKHPPTLSCPSHPSSFGPHPLYDAVVPQSPHLWRPSVAPTWFVPVL
jgi:hypothetical protein